MPRPLTALLVLGLTLLGLAGCGGGGEEDEYGDDFRQVSERIVSLGEEVGESIQSAGDATDEALADEFGGFARDLGELQGRLDELEPPEDLADRHDELVTAVGGVQGSLEDIATAAERSDPEAARDATIELVERSEDLRDARRELADAVREQD